jgi:hypothetical protein
MIDTYPPTWVVTNVGRLSTIGSDPRAVITRAVLNVSSQPWFSKESKINQKL